MYLLLIIMWFIKYFLYNKNVILWSYWCIIWLSIEINTGWAYLYRVNLGKGLSGWVCIYIPPVKIPNITIAGAVLASDAIASETKASESSQGWKRWARRPPQAADWLAEWSATLRNPIWLAVRREYTCVRG